MAEHATHQNPVEVSPAPSVMGVAANVRLDRPDSTSLARALVDQLLQHHGCKHDAHHPEHPRPPNVVTMADLIQRDCPDVLGVPTIAQHPTQWNQLFLPEQRRLLYTGLDCGPSLSASTAPPVVDVKFDTQPYRDSFQVRLDIDSAGGWASNLAVARAGLQWRAGRPAVSNLQSSLHLDHIQVQWTDSSTGRLRHARRPIHHVPHLPFGRLAEFPEVEMYLVFPRLYEPTRQHWVITKEEYILWTDHIFLPALRQVYPSSIVQHLPSSAAHIQLNATAARREGLARADVEIPHLQDFHFTLQSEALATLWDDIQQRIERAPHSQFQQCQILLTAKNLKLTTQRSTWAAVRDVFFSRWNRAVDATYLEQDFYDVAKEVLPFQLDPTADDSTPPALMLIWRECCLYGFRDWLCQHEVSAEVAPEVVSSPNAEPVRRSQRLATHPSSDIISPGVVVSDNASSGDAQSDPCLATDDEFEEEPVRSDEPSLPGSQSHDFSTRNSTPISSPSPHPSARWRQEYYTQSFVRAHGSMTLEPYPKSPLRKQGLLYCQLYNTSKDILAAGNHYPFQNERLDTLALDPGMVRTWQHIGGAVSHSPLTLLRAYLHTKQRCHAALQGCRNRCYGTREEYRVTGTVLVDLDRQLQQRACADTPLTMLSGPTPFFIHTTALMLDWWRWNLNKLCLGFEMTYSLQPRTVVHWEHTRVMIMFLQCLMCAYGGQGRHQLRYKLGLWIHWRVRPPREGSETDQVQEGMGMGDHLERYGYAWFADKLDWTAMTFRSPHRAHIIFNTPTLQSAYHRRYWRVVGTKNDFLLFHDIFYRLQDLRHDPRRSALLLQLLVDLCLRSFRKDVFQALVDRHTQQPLNPQTIQEACTGLVPLTGQGYRHVFQRGIVEDDLRFVTGSNMHVSHVEILFAWLWGWDGDGNQGDWERAYWECKPYRLFYRQCFGIIAQIHGMQQAREWRQRLKQTFIRTHWVLPYPSSQSFWSRGPHKRLQTWVSVHPGLTQYYQDRQPPHSGVIAPHEVDDLPVSGWERGAVPSALNIALPPIPTDLDAWLGVLDSSPPVSRGDIPLPARGMRDSGLSRYLQQSAPSQRVLRSFLHDRVISQSQLHTNEEWFSQHLVDHLRASIAAYQQEIRSLQPPNTVRQWQARARPRLTQGLNQLNLSVQQIEDDDSDPEGTRHRQRRLARRLGRMQKRLDLSLHELRRLNQCRDLMKLTHHVAYNRDRTLTKKQWDEEIHNFHSVRYQYRLSKKRLGRLSQESTPSCPDRTYLPSLF